MESSRTGAEGCDGDNSVQHNMPPRKRSWKDSAPRIDTSVTLSPQTGGGKKPSGSGSAVQAGDVAIDVAPLPIGASKSMPVALKGGAPKAMKMSHNENKVTSPGEEQSDVSLGPLETPTAENAGHEVSKDPRFRGRLLLTTQQLVLVFVLEVGAIFHVFTPGLGISSSALFDCFSKENDPSKLLYRGRWMKLIIVEILTAPLRLFFLSTFFLGAEFLVILFHYHTLRHCIDLNNRVAPVTKDAARIGFFINVAAILIFLFVVTLVMEPALIILECLGLAYVCRSRADPPTRPEEQRTLTKSHTRTSLV